MTSSLGCLPYTMTSSFEPVCEYIVLFIVTGLVKMELWHGQQCFVCSATIYLQVCKPCAAGSAQPSGASLECEPCQSLAGARVVTCKPWNLRRLEFRERNIIEWASARVPPTPITSLEGKDKAVALAWGRWPAGSGVRKKPLEGFGGFSGESY